MQLDASARLLMWPHIATLLRNPLTRLDQQAAEDRRICTWVLLVLRGDTDPQASLDLRLVRRAAELLAGTCTVSVVTARSAFTRDNVCMRVYQERY